MCLLLNNLYSQAAILYQIALFITLHTYCYLRSMHRIHDVLDYTALTSSKSVS
jgi:hypothetical protein